MTTELNSLLDQYNAIGESLKKYLNSLGVSNVNVKVDDLDEAQFNAVIEWFKDGGKFTKYYSKYSEYEHYWWYRLKKGLVNMTVGSKKIQVKKRREPKNWMTRLGNNWAQEIKEREDAAAKAKLQELGRKYSWHEETLLPYVEQLFGEAINEK